MANLTQLLKNFYYDSNVEISLNPETDQFESKAHLNTEVQLIINNYISNRNVEDYSAALKTKFEDFLTKKQKEHPGDEDFILTEKDRILLDECFSQAPLILPSNSNEKEIFLAVLSAQLIQFQIHSLNNYAIFSAKIMTSDEELIIFSTPFSHTHKRECEQYLKACTKQHPYQDWKILRDKQSKKTITTSECLHELISEFENTFKTWPSFMSNINAMRDLTPNDLFFELWTIFTYFIVPSERTDVNFSAKNTFLTQLLSLSLSIRNDDFIQMDRDSLTLIEMLEKCCQHLTEQEVIIAQRSSHKETAIPSESLSESRSETSVETKKQFCTSWFYGLFCCGRKNTSLTEPLINYIANKG